MAVLLVGGGMTRRCCKKRTCCVGCEMSRGRAVSTCLFKVTAAWWRVVRYGSVRIPHYCPFLDRMQHKSGMAITGSQTKLLSLDDFRSLFKQKDSHLEHGVGRYSTSQE